jgi:hypothetical protein
MLCTYKVSYKIRDKRRAMLVADVADLRECWICTIERKCHGTRKRRVVARCADFLAPGVSKRGQEGQETKRYMIL